MDTSINPGKTTQSHAHTHMEGFQHWIEGVHIQFPTFKHDHHHPELYTGSMADLKQHRVD